MIAGPLTTPPRLFAVRLADPNPTQPTVLNASVQARLQIINAAVRRLRAMGIRVLAHRVDGEFPSDDEPTVRIVREPAVSIAALLDAAGPRGYWTRVERGQRVTTAFCLFDGVLVLWEEL